MLYQVVDRIDIYRDRVEIHVNIKMDMYENGLSDRLQASTTELITVPARIEDSDNFPMVACGADETVLSGQSIIGGVNSVSLAGRKSPFFFLIERKNPRIGVCGGIVTI